MRTEYIGLYGYPRFSVPAETLAVFVAEIAPDYGRQYVETTKQQYWAGDFDEFVVEITGKKRSGSRWCLGYCEDVLILQDDDVPSPSYVQWSYPCPGCIIGDGLNPFNSGGSLPPEMLPALRKRVQTHLLGRSLTPLDRVQIAASMPETLMPVERILDTTGSLGRPYDVLGEITYKTNVESMVTAIQANMPLLRERMQFRLREVARQTYGNEVDAVVNMTSDVDSDGNAYGSGLAVRFVEQSPRPVNQVPCHPRRTALYKTA